MTEANDISSLDKLSQFEPLITMADIDRGEALEKDRGVLRRLMLVALTKSSDELFSVAEKSPDTAKELFSCVNDYIGSLRALLEMSTACSSRLLASLSCLQDEEFKVLMDEWAEATEI